MGPDELRARQLLLDMQERLGRDPFEALGLDNTEPAEVRSAFLQLTKIYHPARFARMTVETQRLSNEVFLELRAAADAFARPQIKLPAARSTGVFPIVRPPPTAATSAASPPSGSMSALRPPPPSLARPARPTARPATRTAPPPTTSTPLRPATGAAPATGIHPSTPRPGQPAAETTQAMRPAAITDSRPARTPSSPPPSTVSDAELATIHELLAQGRLADARMKLETVVARQPNVPRYQALIHYAKGREAQLAGRRDEARLELLDALDLDRDLQLANTALSELLSKRK